VGFLAGGPSSAGAKALREGVLRSAAHHSVDARIEEATQPDDIEPAISGLAKQGVQALVVLATPLLSAERGRIVKLALAHRWPVIGFSHEWPEAGAVLSYGVDVVASYRRAAYFVDRILKGAKPGDLPIEQPTRLELVINAKAAKALGLTISQELRLRADRVIE
jgi:putative ABC transport system substrate-binding protein